MKHAVARALDNITGADIAVEPFIRGTRRRNDVRLVATDICPIPPIEIDVSVVAVSNITAPARRGASQPDSPDAVAAVIQRSLNVRANQKRRKQHAQSDPAGFLPFILSAGGVFLDETEKAVAEWRRYIPPSEMGFFLNKTACALLNRRVSSFSPGMV